MREEEWFSLFTNSGRIFFAEGLTQMQESDPETGGYDVSINYTTDGEEARLMFLQYKAGRRAHYCESSSSQFSGTAKDVKPHVIFTFNDAAKKKQHSILRKLARQLEVPNCVLYVFPRITERADFIRNLKNLLVHTSFVPVLEIDRQGAEQDPPVALTDGVSHRYRTSYDGNTSEVNYYYYYDQETLSKVISELVCIELERFFKFLKKSKKPSPAEIALPLINLRNWINTEEGMSFKGIALDSRLISNYLDQFEFQGLSADSLIVPRAPQKYTMVIPARGLVLKMENRSEAQDLNYQIF